MQHNPELPVGGEIVGRGFTHPWPLAPDSHTFQRMHQAAANRSGDKRANFLVQPKQAYRIVVTLRRRGLTRVTQIIVHPADVELAAANAAAHLARPYTGARWHRGQGCLIRSAQGDITVSDEVHASSRLRAMRMPLKWRTGLFVEPPLPRNPDGLCDLIEAALLRDATEVQVNGTLVEGDEHVVAPSWERPYERAMAWNWRAVDSASEMRLRWLDGDRDAQPVVVYNHPVDPRAPEVDQALAAARRVTKRSPVLAPGFPLRRELAVELSFRGQVQGHITWRGTSDAPDEDAAGAALAEFVRTSLAHMAGGDGNAAWDRLRRTQAGNSLVTSGVFVKGGVTVELRLHGPSTVLGSWLRELIRNGVPLDRWSQQQMTPSQFAAGLTEQYGSDFCVVRVTSRFLPSCPPAALR